MNDQLIDLDKLQTEFGPDPRDGKIDLSEWDAYQLGVIRALIDELRTARERQVSADAIIALLEIENDELRNALPDGPDER